MAAACGLADILHHFGAAYLSSHVLPGFIAKVWRAILACRTPALGGHIETCTTCGTIRHVYHSCRNRHCPQCQTQAKEAWLAARRRELLPVPYFHVVFTLPHALHGLVNAGQARLIYETLFAAAAQTLNGFAGRNLGGEAAFSLLLHTWKQDLSRHLHVHALMAGGALNAAGGWQSPKPGFLFPVQALSVVFRGKFMAALGQQRAAGKLPGLNDAAWRRLKQALYVHRWAVYAKAPLGGPAQVLEYLARYTHRVAISNERIIGINQDAVLFRGRADENGKKPVLRLPGVEFIRRFLLHVLPPGFKRIRHYGLLSPARKTLRLAAARRALESPLPDPVVIESVVAFLQRVAQIDRQNCPRCKVGQFEVTGTLLPVPREPP